MSEATSADAPTSDATGSGLPTPGTTTSVADVTGHDETGGRHPHGQERGVRLCFVCLGNICRSPTAEAIMRHLVANADVGPFVVIDSAGTSAYHAGDPPDRRSTAAAARHGVRLDGQSRQFTVEDFERFDHIIAMDGQNLRNLRRLARGPADLARLSLLRQWRPEHDGPDMCVTADVPDPYYDVDDGFETVFRICTVACSAILATLLRQSSVSPVAPKIGTLGRGAKAPDNSPF